MTYLARASIALIVIALLVAAIGQTHPAESEGRAVVRLFAGICAACALIFLALAWWIQ